MLKTVYFQRGKLLQKLMTFEIDPTSIKKLHTKFQLNILKHVHVGEKCRKLYFLHSKFQKGHNSDKYRGKLTTLEPDLKVIGRKSYTKFQLNVSKHV